jgi:hypothetical protein
MNSEQLDALRRQVEEDYRQDIAAIERLQRRFLGSSGSSSGAASPTAARGAVIEARGTPLQTADSRGQGEPDELTGTLRAIFSNQRK